MGRGTQLAVACRLPKPERTLVASPKARTTSAPDGYPQWSSAEATCTGAGAGRIGWMGWKKNPKCALHLVSFNEWMPESSWREWKCTRSCSRLVMIGDWWVSDDRREEKVCVLSAPDSRVQSGRAKQAGLGRIHAMLLALSPGRPLVLSVLLRPWLFLYYNQRRSR